MPRHRDRWRWLIPALIALSGSGCTSIFVDHTDTMQGSVAYLQAGYTEKALQKVRGRDGANCRGADRRLYLLEAGRIAQLGDRREDSVRYYELALEQFREDDRAALIEGHRLVAGGISLVSNEKAIPYRPPSYERVLTHHYQALNFLEDGDVEAAAVEVRNAVSLQEESRKRYQEEVDAGREKLRREYTDGDADDLEKNIKARMSGMAATSSKALSSFQNPAVWYLSGLVYEGVDDPGNALLSYRKAWEIWPDNPYLHRDILRLAQRESTEVYEEFKDRFPGVAEAGAAVDASSCAEVIVMVEQDFVPMREAFFFALPISGQIVSTAFPYYDTPPMVPRPCRVSWNDEPQGQTAQIGSFQALAYRALEEKMPILIVRAIARGLSKYAVADAVGDQGDWTLVLANMVNLITEQADLRAWYSLPGTVQIWRGTLPAGTGTLVIRDRSGAGSWSVNRMLRAGDVLLVYLADIGPRTHLETMLLSDQPRLEPSPGGVEETPVKEEPGEAVVEAPARESAEAPPKPLAE